MFNTTQIRVAHCLLSDRPLPFSPDLHDADEARMRSGISALRRLQLEAVGNLIDLLDESEGDSDLEPSCGSEAAALNPQMDECEPVSEHDDRERDDADLEPALGWASGAFGEWERAHA